MTPIRWNEPLLCEWVINDVQPNHAKHHQAGGAEITFTNGLRGFYTPSGQPYALDLPVITQGSSDPLTWRTRLHFADLEQRCITDALDGTTRVNDLASYVEWCNNSIINGMAGDSVHTFTFQQYRHYLATGECVPLLAP